MERPIYGLVGGKRREKKFEFTIEHSYGLLFYFLYLRWCVWLLLLSICTEANQQKGHVHINFISTAAFPL
jgi:hypothetical protein